MTDRTTKSLNVGIVGAGVAGLTTAIALRIHSPQSHRVTVFEKYPERTPVFSGPVQLQPNATRILTRYGVADAIRECLPELVSVHNIHRYSDGELFRSTPASEVNSAYQSPVWNISRYQLSKILLERARAVGVEFKFNTAVQGIDASSTSPTVRTESGETYSYDLVIAADGIRSAIRATILGQQVQPTNPLTAYSFNVPRAALAADPDLKFLLNRSGLWIGPYCAVNQMDMPDFNDSCNFCFTIEAQGGVAGEWNTQCDMDEVQSRFAAFEPRIHKVLALADSAPYIWKLSDIAPLETWWSENKRVVLIGDAAHAMLPYSAMGAASGIEDALCLAECLEQASSVETAMDAFETIRKPRTSFIAEAGNHNMRMLNLPDGPEQQARDAAFIKSAESAAAANPKMAAPEAAEQETTTSRQLKDFDPPPVVTGTFVPSTRAYLIDYDVYNHTTEYFRAAA